MTVMTMMMMMMTEPCYMMLVVIREKKIKRVRDDIDYLRHKRRVYLSRLISFLCKSSFLCAGKQIKDSHLTN